MRRRYDMAIPLVMRHEGVPYKNVLTVCEITPKQFFVAATRDLEKVIDETDHINRRVLSPLLDAPYRVSLLFDMEDFVFEHYDLMMQGKQKEFLSGTSKSEKNIQKVIHYAFKRAHDKLASHGREEVIEGLYALPKNLKKHLIDDLKVGGIMRGYNCSPLLALNFFDQGYMAETNDLSLMDLDAKTHFHFWSITVPQRFWSDPSKKYLGISADDAIYHSLTEYSPNLGSENRADVLNGIRALSGYIYEFIKNLGLKRNIDKRNNIKSILACFDREFIRRTGNQSLFDVDQEDYLKFKKQFILEY